MLSGRVSPTQARQAAHAPGPALADPQVWVLSTLGCFCPGGVERGCQRCTPRFPPGACLRLPSTARLLRPMRPHPGPTPPPGSGGPRGRLPGRAWLQAATASAHPPAGARPPAFAAVIALAEAQRHRDEVSALLRRGRQMIHDSRHASQRRRQELGPRRKPRRGEPARPRSADIAAPAIPRPSHRAHPECACAATSELCPRLRAALTPRCAGVAPAPLRLRTPGHALGGLGLFHTGPPASPPPPNSSEFLRLRGSAQRCN